MKNIILTILTLTALSFGAFFMSCKFADRIEEKQQKRELVTISNKQIRVDKIMTEYYGKPVNFEALNRMTPEQLDTIIKQAGF